MTNFKQIAAKLCHKYLWRLSPQRNKQQAKPKFQLWKSKAKTETEAALKKNNKNIKDTKITNTANVVL